MKRFINYGSIGQLRNVIKELEHACNNEPLPFINATVTEKVHGTNAAVCFNSVDGLWVQSRNNIITPDADNAGCATFVDADQGIWTDIVIALSNHYHIDLEAKTVALYFEWSGGNIQKNSALSGLDKRAMLFNHFKVVDRDGSPDENGYEACEWFENIYDAPDSNIFMLTQSQTWEVQLDFQQPAVVNNDLLRLVNDIEANSPLGKSFGIDGNVGEGVVVAFEHNGRFFRFKAKGEKHSATKVKTLSPADAEKEQRKIEFVNRVVTPARLEQAWQTVFGIENEKTEPDVKFTGEFIKAVSADVVKEESDILAEADLTMKDVGSLLSKQARVWFMTELNS